MILAETVLELFKSPAHWVFELSLEAFTGLLLYPAGRWLLRRHDERHHHDKPAD